MGSGESMFKRLCHRLYGNKEVRILMCGLGGAGKTTALYKLKLGEVVTTIPTIGFNVETIDYKNVHWTMWDVGGRDKTRPLWRHYYQNTDVIIFVVDSSDFEQISVCQEQLQTMLNEDELRDVVLLVLANKQDLPNAMSVQEITEKLGLHALRNRLWYIQSTCATSGDGLYEGLEWLQYTLSKREVKKTLTQPLTETTKSASDTISKPSLLSSWLSSIGGYFHSRTVTTT
ncbi:hypothetical protein EMCRGX_G026050 [Ephydatia muelleri]|eukprot:Em0021g803a